MVYLAEMDPKTGFLSAEIARDKGAELAEQYQSARPFPHIAIDDFLPPSVLEQCLKNFPQSNAEGFDRGQERNKFQFCPDHFDPWTRALFYSFNSRPFIEVLQNITGIKHLIGDPYFLGGGFHEIRTGGHLSVHADFNHHKPMDVERRINVLIYLNKDWKLEYGGGLELWDREMKECVVRLPPVFNRCVIFNTDSYSYHGNPDPVQHPDGLPRRSIALYYYTATWSADKRDHTTQFRVRPGSEDRTDWQTIVRERLIDLMPPLLYRQLKSHRSRD